MDARSTIDEVIVVEHKKDMFVVSVALDILILRHSS